MADHGSTILTHKQLHALVWVTPMIRLAERCGLTDNGLRKICRKLDRPIRQPQAAENPARDVSLIRLKSLEWLGVR